MPLLTLDELNVRRNPPRPLTPEDEAFLETVYEHINGVLTTAEASGPLRTEINVTLPIEMVQRIVGHKEMNERFLLDLDKAGWPNPLKTSSTSFVDSKVRVPWDTITFKLARPLGTPQGYGRGQSARS